MIKCVDVFDHQGRIWIFLEYMEDGNLTEMIYCQHEVYSEDFCRWVLYKTALGLLHMHSKNILHRDIKSDNILCGSKGDIKISDLGFSAYLTSE